MSDHLHPEEGPFHARAFEPYLAALTRLLITEERRVLQMVTLPSFHRESAVYVRQEWSGPLVVSARLESNLRGQLAERVREKADGKPVTLRTEELYATLGEWQPTVEVARAPIGEPLLTQLERLWHEALMGTRYPAKALVHVDGTRYHFSTRTMFGRTWSPSRGSRMAALVDVGEKLASYAWAPEAQRAAAGEELLAEVDALLQRLIAVDES